MTHTTAPITDSADTENLVLDNTQQEYKNADHERKTFYKLLKKQRSEGSAEGVYSLPVLFPCCVCIDDVRKLLGGLIPRVAAGEQKGAARGGEMILSVEHQKLVFDTLVAPRLATTRLVYYLATFKGTRTVQGPVTMHQGLEWKKHYPRKINDGTLVWCSRGLNTPPPIDLGHRFGWSEVFGNLAPKHERPAKAFCFCHKPCGIDKGFELGIGHGRRPHPKGPDLHFAHRAFAVDRKLRIIRSDKARSAGNIDYVFGHA